ncbi:LytTR family transcriptional regulator DNA-binding domain-containing protein [Sphingobacterium haloxyli]|uniref:Uncharacterized protein n=1 Tax=Sphingobacterium haloxyli TaxID=2100533 RepID=A0A2S9J6Y6_9SPHI|nr:LytTR family transcriptional regulator DNA-binding domain-containing protein [Sphingobacterium haloxyli]PRD48532.1 hypothetical protein C5745_04845 [Sphingobacterium haloxyli]
MKKVPPISAKEKAEPSPNRYRDFWPIMFASVVFSGILCNYGYRGGILESATHREFLDIWLRYFLACSVVLFAISIVTKRLDEKWPWDINFYQRAVWQVFCCLFLPSMTILGVFVLFSFILPLSLRESTFLHIDIYIVVLLLFAVNTCYIIAFYMKEADLLREQLRSERSAWEEDGERKNAAFGQIAAEDKKKIQSLKEDLVVLQTKFDTYKDAMTVKASADTAAEEDKVYLHKLGATTRRIRHREIALFFMRDGVPWFGLKNGEEYIATEKTLTEVHKAVGDRFFVVRRSFLINDSAIERCVRRKDKRLVLYLRDKNNTEIFGPVEPDENLEKRILNVVDIVAERKT